METWAIEVVYCDMNFPIGKTTKKSDHWKKEGRVAPPPIEAWKILYFALSKKKLLRNKLL